MGSINDFKSDGRKLTWQSSGFDAFLLVRGSMPEPALPGKQNEWISAGDAEVYFTPFECRQQSVDITKPGSYLLYGVDQGNGVPVLSGPWKCEVKRKITINMSPVEKNVRAGFLGLGRPREEYSGYWKIQISEPQRDLSGSCLHYQVNDYSVAFPDEVVKNSGSFYVCAPKQPRPQITAEDWLTLIIPNG